jgi:hypothetical protein
LLPFHEQLQSQQVYKVAECYESIAFDRVAHAKMAGFSLPAVEEVF